MFLEIVGVPGGDRNRDPMIKSHVLYLLSYRHIYWCTPKGSNFDELGYEPRVLTN